MTEQEIRDTVYSVLEENFEIDPARLTPAAQIFSDLGLDSLDIVDLVVALQQAFGVRLRENAGIRSIRTVQDLCEFIARVKQDDVVT